MEERIEKLEESDIQQHAASLTLLGIVRDIDENVKKISGTVQALQVQSTIVDARLNAQDARLSAVEARLGTVDSKLDQVIALLRKPGE